jgi:hypothetical protein
MGHAFTPHCIFHLFRFLCRVVARKLDRNFEGKPHQTKIITNQVRQKNLQRGKKLFRGKSGFIVVLPIDIPQYTVGLPWGPTYKAGVGLGIRSARLCRSDGACFGFAREYYKYASPMGFLRLSLAQ